MPVDKDMCRTVTIRFSLLKQDHVRLLEKMEQECREGSRKPVEAGNDASTAGRTGRAYGCRGG